MVKRNVRYAAGAMALVAAIAGLAGCQTSEPDKTAAGQSVQAAAAISTEPVTLKFYVHKVRLTDREFQRLVAEPLKKKHPNISLEVLTGNIEDLVASGSTPDLILTDNDWFSALRMLELPQNLTELTKQLQMNVSAFVPESIQASKQLTDDGNLYAIPFSMNTGALFYNKDMFDKFGVTYPKDNMTWNEVLEASRKLTRLDSGVQYIGWEPGFPDAIASPYTQPFVDSKTNKAVIDTDTYRKVFELMKKVYEQPGFIGPDKTFRYAPKDFIVTQKVGMMTEWSIKMMGDLIDSVEAGTNFNWDMATIPNFEDRAGKGRHMLASMMVVSKTSRYKQQAMQVIETVTSTEAQSIQAANARVPVLTDQAVIQQYGKAFPWLANKNTASLFKFKASPIPKPHLYDKEVQPIIRNIAKAISVDNKDINSALREAQEQADKRLQELLQK
ncbi:MAG: transporter substrate-binding protein [Paenibacillus sp.]|jgi:multiple sugar transport system substrate-binding protein|nr:transporter substrate-binding protein [Paenibacillus sp.]